MNSTIKPEIAVKFGSTQMHKRNKILFVQTNYPAFLKSFYAKNLHWEKLSYKRLEKIREKELFGTSGYYSKSLKKLDWDANEIVVDDWNSQSKWAQENNTRHQNPVDSLLKLLPFPIKTRFRLVDKWIFSILLSQVKYYKPDVVYFHHLNLLEPNELRIIKKQTNLIVGQIASPLPKEDTLYEFDLLISSFPHYVKKFRRMGINSQYLKWCAEKSILKRVGKFKRIYNVSYVGAFSPHHSKGNKVFEELTRSQNVDFWGYGENTLRPGSPIKKSLHGQAWGKDMYEIYAKSKIVVNRHINVSGKYANNMRMYEATLMGALLITDYKKNISEIFVDGKEILTYYNSKDLIKKVKYYLIHPNEGEKIAKAGQKRTLKDHSYEVRMKELDKILKQYL